MHTDISYSGCGLPYYVGGQVADADELHPRTPAWFAKRYNMDIRTGHEVIAVNHEARTMRVVELATGEEFTDSYDTLVLATGARTIVPPIPGVDAPGVFAVRNVQKALQIVDVRSAKDYAKARVPGAVNIPLGEIRDRAGELDPQATTVTYCNKGVSRPPGRPAVWQHGDRRPRSRTE